MRKAIIGGALVALLAGCAQTQVAVGPQPASGPATTVPVPTPVAGLATLTDTDLKQAMAELAATNGGKPPTAVPLVDDYQCVSWMDSQLPVWIQMANGVIPTQKPAGAISAFITVKIAAVNGQAAVNTFQTTLTNDFAHNCGAAFAQDENFIVAALNKVGINVALPAAGAAIGLPPLPLLPGL